MEEKFAFVLANWLWAWLGALIHQSFVA